MRVALLSLFLVALSFQSEARDFGRPGFGGNDFGWDQPSSCTFNLEKKASDFSTRYYFITSFTEFGFRACMEAEADCERERMGKWDSWKYRCTQEVSTPRPRPIERCEYRIEVGRQHNRRFLDGEYVGYGIDACWEAEQSCEDELDYLRRRGQVGRQALCVITSGSVRPTPRPRPPQPPRMVSASCSAELIAGRVGRPTGNIYSGVAQARNYTEARQRACADALRECSQHERGSLRCVIRD